ncbi:SNF1-related protein kinase regulatory subunit gamma-1 [Zostera marina]|uniref:SNF1-related protein kinase regulatory subunit gamma-1 n=1 Tax=Zostera marina TaxID=29655 RepID=A0A0K9PGS4_ZOSMR|nr:SNF1-related protein kinase regulatory subunit gamma-1 [Zostera marina]
MERQPQGRMERSTSLEIGMRVEDLWDVQENILTPSEKLNSCFEAIPVSDFPLESSSQVVEIPSDSSLDFSVQVLSKHKLLSVPVYDVDAPKDSSWIDRYIGMVEFDGIVAFAEVAALEPTSPLFEEGSIEASGILDTIPDCMSPTRSGPEVIVKAGGSFFKKLISSDLYKNAKVEDIWGSFGWAPFLPLQNSDTFLTMLLLLSKYRMKTLLVVDLGEGKIDNIITQSAAIHMLAECVGLPWFEKWATKKLSELSFPVLKSDQLVKIINYPVLKAFKLMRMKGIGGLTVVDVSGRKAIGNISIRDTQFLLTTPKLFKDHNSITVKNFVLEVRKHLKNGEKGEEEENFVNFLYVDVFSHSRYLPCRLIGHILV